VVDIHTILADHRPKLKSKSASEDSKQPDQLPTYAEIPDLFFDHILRDFKLNRGEILVLMFVYRMVWCRPNLYKEYGISQLMSYTDISQKLKIEIDVIYAALRTLEGYGFISTVRSGQYFVRKYFLKELDDKLGQTYDNFETI